jgi:hypothetical protein
MSKFKVAYIDESESDIRRFQRFAYNYFDTIPIKPNPDIEKTLSEVLNSQVDAVIADFELSEQDSTIHYNGANLINFVLQARELFPVFILTSHENDAVSKGDDVNIIYEKLEMSSGENFLERVKAQIEKYRYKLEASEKRLLSLIEESKIRELNAYEEDELIELDKQIEKSLDRASIIPNVARKKEEAKDISKLLKDVNDLVNKLKQ